jgi:EAL domain-containing protein (putative c-di-GMP-specific phosphodiesterase class I)
VRQLIADPDSLAFIRTIVGLGATLGIPVCVEGIEREDQYEWARALGCNEAQGYLFGRPVPAEQARMFMSDGLIGGHEPAQRWAI